MYAKDPAIKEAMDMFEKAKANDEVLELIRLREEAQNEVTSQIAEGEKRGEKRGADRERAKAIAEKKESARKMLLKGMDIPDVADIICLSIEEINEIKKKLQ